MFGCLHVLATSCRESSGVRHVRLDPNHLGIFPTLTMPLKPVMPTAPAQFGKMSAWRSPWCCSGFIQDVIVEPQPCGIVFHQRAGFRKPLAAPLVAKLYEFSSSGH